MPKKIELVFTNSEKGNPRAKRWHADLASAAQEVRRIRIASRNKHGKDDPEAYFGNAIAYGEGCGPDGRAIAWPILKAGDEMYA